MFNRKVFIRVVEVLLCIACVVTLRITDDESRRVFHYLRSRSREWSLLNNITWGTIGAALATVTCGGYVIITTGLLVAAATGELRGRKTEFLFLALGVVLFAIVGALSLASIEDVPDELVDNAVIFGILCLLTALLFIADLLMKPPKDKDKKNMIQNMLDKDTAKQVTTTLMMEKDSKSTMTNNNAKSSDNKEDLGNVNEGFDKTDDKQRNIIHQDESEDLRRMQQERSLGASNQRSKDVYQEERNRNFDNVERELREYTQNFENGKTLRDSQRLREAEMQRSAGRTSHDGRRIDEPKVMYKMQDIYQRPVDEVDTPRFPTDAENRSELVFAKVLNPGVRIMRVEHDVEEALDPYRYSDNSQYDNVPVRMRGSSPGILKKNRDVTFNVPPPSKVYNKERERSKDEIEMLEECLGALRTTGTQTGVRAPSNPTDPGYVRHTVSNWPQETRGKTPSASPDRRSD